MASGNKSFMSELNAEADDKGEWITTYADLVTLLLTFFIMLFSISSLDAEKFKELLSSIQANLGQGTAIMDVTIDQPDLEPMEFNDDPVRDIPLGDLEEPQDDLMNDVKQVVEKTRLGDNIVVYQEKDRITIIVDGQIFFGSGQADLMPGALPILDDITALIQKYPDYRINIKGHTDDDPISTVQFPSNWELSAVRATTVLRYLLYRGVDASRLTATGYGELLPIASNDTPEGRARNRRVEFVLEKEKKGRADRH